MKKYILLIVFILLPFINNGQEHRKDDLDAYFFSLIVKNIDSAIVWYEDVLGFKMVNFTKSEERGFKIANLKRDDVALELISLTAALNPKDLIPNFNPKTRLVGIFKFGFRVANFSHWENHINAKNVEVYGNVVSDPTTGKKMVIILDPDGNRIQLFEK